MTYQALDTIRIPKGERNEEGKQLYRTEWKTLGLCSGMEDAKEKFGGYPVLEVVQTVH